MKFRRQKKPTIDLNLAPLIDVVFLLLIFFMVSTTFTKETHLTVRLPEAVSAVSDENTDRAIEVVINSAGEYTLNGNKLVNRELATLLAGLSKISEGDSTLPLVITADAEAPHQSVVRVMDAAGQLGFVNLNLTTVYPKSQSDR